MTLLHTGRAAALLRRARVHFAERAPGLEAQEI